MEFFGTGSPLGQCQLLVMECKEPLGANVKRLVAFAGRIGLPVTHCDGAFIKIDTLRLLLDELHNSYSIERRRKLVLCGGCLEEQVSVIAQHLLLTGFDVLLIRNLVQESSPDHAHIHDCRLVQSGVVMTTLEQLVYEWTVNERDTVVQASLVQYLKSLK